MTVESQCSEIRQGDELSKEKSHPGPESPMTSPRWAQVLPFFLSAIFFLSAVFSFFAPFPILFLSLRQGRKVACLGLATNSCLVALLSGWSSLAVFLVLAGVLGLILPELLKRKWPIEKAVGTTLLAMVAMGVLFAGIEFQLHHLSPIEMIRSQISYFVDYLNQSLSNHSEWVSSADIETWKKDLLLEFPSSMAIFGLLIIVVNLALLLRISSDSFRKSIQLEKRFFQKWKISEYLVWPVILSGLFLVFDAGVVSDIAWNLFRFFMAIYALQGLGILSYLFDVWGFKGGLRWIGFSLALFIMMPLVLSLGFFDLWFDFRGKFRQT